ncbi:MAG: LLM class flavin-dependent oxidoreductase [Gammaproteobacteria bacterium]|nr:LLM class flavin-dependent oxidoreductase [Gammaproteobacteria bacterium]
MEIDVILEADVTPAQVAELAKIAEGYGIRGLWAQNYANGRDPFMCLMPAAMVTKKIMLGAVVISPYEMHPLKIANAVATLNEFSNGRGMVVIGGGGEWPGVLNKPYGKRVKGVGEAIAMAKRAVRGEVVVWDGEVYKSRYFRSTWVKGTPPIIYAGATGPKMLDMATRFADGTMFSDMIVPMLPKCMADVRDGLARHGRSAADFRVNNFCAFHIKEDREASFREARRELMIRGWLEEAWYKPFLTPDEARIVHEKKDAFLTAFRTKVGEIKGVPPEIVAKLVEGLSLAGDPGDLDRHVERLKTFAAGGLTENALRLHDEPEKSLHLIGKQLLPRLRR